MEMIKAAALAGCLIGVAITMLGVIAPDNSARKITQSVMSIILVIAMLTPFVSESSDSLPVISDEVSLPQESEEYLSYADEILISETRAELEKTIGIYFQKEEIPFEEISIQLEIDEYNYLEVSVVSVETDEEYRNAVKEIISELLGEDIEIIFT